jgi:hypothetical protein
MDRREAEWLQRIKGKDVVGILRTAGMPCIGIRNYIPQFEDGYKPDVERVWELLSGGVDGRASESTTPPITVKKKGGRPPGSKDRQKRKPRS